MSQFYEHDFQFEAAANLEAHRLVKLTGSREVNYLAAADTDPTEAIGVTMHKANQNDIVHVRSLKAGGSVMVEAAGEIASVNSLIKPADSGKVQAAGSSETEPVIGRNLETAAGDEAVIECWLLPMATTKDTS